MITGNVLVVDNEYDDVKQVIHSLENSGLNVIYMDSPPETGKCPSNIRLLILDLDLGGLGESPTDEDIAQAVLVLRRIENRTKFYLVALWSRYIDESENWEEILRNEYKEETGNDFPYFLKSFGKKIGFKKLLKEIEDWIDKNPYAGAVFELENIIEDSRDAAVSDIANSGGIVAILKSIIKETGKVSAPRELSFLFGKLLLRHSSLEDRLKNLVLLTDKIDKKQIKDGGDIFSWYQKFYNLQAYFRVEKNEPLWTGDIIMRKETKDEFAVILNPPCDFSQQKVKNIKIAYAIGFNSIPEYNQNDSDVPPVVEWIGKMETDQYRKKENIVQHVIYGRGLTENFYPLRFLSPTLPFDNYFHILVNISKVRSLKANYYSGGGVRVPSGWNRICRLDTPYIQDLIQKYSSFTARVGTPDLPKSVVTQFKKGI